MRPLMPTSYRDRDLAPRRTWWGASDLHPLQPINNLLKYARHIQSAAAEFDNISRWAAANNFRLNPLKTKELIVHRKRDKLSTIPELPFIQGATRVTSLRVLGTTINSTLSMSDHIDGKLATCASSIYARLVQHTARGPESGPPRVSIRPSEAF